MPSNADYTREYFQIIDELDGDIESRRAAFNYMQDSTAIVHHQVVASSFVPRLFNRKTYEVMKRTAETSHRILCKVIERYRADEEYRKLFDFDERLVELILLPRDYDSVLPFARVDTFLNENDYRIHFCEFNGDGSAGMNENREITNSIVGSDTFRTFAENHAVQGCDLFMPWVRAFMDIYGTYRFKVENPRVAICDYLENGVVDEFHIFAEKFREAGVECVVADVRELSFDGEDYNLYSVPILLNDEEYNLQVAYNFTDEAWSILGAAKGLDADSGMASKERRLLKEGDVISIIWKIASLSDDDEDFEMYTVDEVTVTADTAFGEAPLFDGTYSMVIEMRDVAGNYAYSDAVSFECADGQVTSTTIYED